MRTRVLNVAGAALIAASICWLVLLLRDAPGGGGVEVRSWLPTPAAHR